MRKMLAATAFMILLLKPEILLAPIALVDALAHSAGFQPCLLTALADALSGLTGLSTAVCFGALVLLGAYVAGRLVFSLVAAMTAYW